MEGFIVLLSSLSALWVGRGLPVKNEHSTFLSSPSCEWMWKKLKYYEFSFFLFFTSSVTLRHQKFEKCHPFRICCTVISNSAQSSAINFLLKEVVTITIFPHFWTKTTVNCHLGNSKWKKYQQFWQHSQLNHQKF